MALDRRRRRLVASGLAGLASLAGCVDIGGREPVDGDASGGSILHLPSLDVEGSPGGPVAVPPQDRVAVIDFFATWCAPCVPEMANLRAARARFDRDAVSIVSITAESDEGAVERFWRRHRGTWPVLLDPDLEATRRYDVTGVPTILVRSAAGDLVLRHTGLAGEERIVGAVREALDRGSDGGGT